MQPEKSADQRERTDAYRRAKEYDMDRPGIALINLDGIRTLIG